MRVFKGQQWDLISTLTLSVLSLDGEWIRRRQDWRWRSPLRRGLLLEFRRRDGGHDYGEEDRSGRIDFRDGIDEVCW